MADYNKRFALKPDSNKNRFVPAPSEQEINYYLSVLYYRQTDSGSCFKFKGKKLQLVDSQGKTLKIPSKQHLDIYETFDNTVVAVYNNKYYETKDAEIIEQQEPEMPEKQITTKKPKWKPAPYHSVEKICG